MMSQNPQPLPNGAINPLALEHGESPLDFINRNLNRLNGTPPPTAPNSQVATNNSTSLTTSTNTGNEDILPEFDFSKKEATSNVPRDSAAPAETPKVPPPEMPPQVPEEIEDSSIPAAENFKRLRHSLKEKEKSISELTSAHKTATEELEKYKKGEILPPVVKEKDEEIKRLSRFERLVNLKTSPEYHEKYIAPLAQKTEQLKTIFKDYGIPDPLVARALAFESRVDLNTFLSEHFDSEGAREVKDIILSTKALTTDAKAAEAEPAQELQKLQEQNRITKLAEDSDRRGNIAASARSGWLDALSEIRNEKKALELIRRENDPKFNETFVDPILKSASEDFSQAISEATNNGVTTISKNYAKAIAKAFMLSHAAALAMETRNRAVDDITTFHNTAERTNRMLRPPIGGGVTNGHIPPPTLDSKTSLKEDTQALLQKVLSERKI